MPKSRGQSVSGATLATLMTNRFWINFGPAKMVLLLPVAWFVADKARLQRLGGGPDGMRASVPSRFVKFLEGVFGI